MTFSPVLTLQEDERKRVLDRIERVIGEQFGGVVEWTNMTILDTARRV
jgi:hypothetical protein